MLEVMWVNTKGFTVGEDAQEVVERMWADAKRWVPEETGSTKDYMAGVARRVAIYAGAEIRYSDEMEFLRELDRVGAITLRVVR